MSDQPLIRDSKDACCEAWLPQLDRVNGPIALQQVRGGFTFPDDHFIAWKFCPWCGASRLLNAPSGASLSREPEKDVLAAARAAWHEDSTPGSASIDPVTWIELLHEGELENEIARRDKIIKQMFARGFPALSREVTDEMVEAGAKAIHGVMTNDERHPWSTLSLRNPKFREWCLRYSRAALTAALALSKTEQP